MIGAASQHGPADHLLWPLGGSIVDWTARGTTALWSRSAAERQAGRFRLPPQPTPLLDRVDERSTATSLLVGDAVRLLTLTGPGGVGKTHLAIALAEAIMPKLADAVRFVDLSASTDVAAASELIAAALDSSGASGLECESAGERGGLEDRTLLVLDNCEHLLPDLAHEIADLLAAEPQVVILATSREPLHLRWEHRLRIQPLGLPEPGDDTSPESLLAAPAVALFVARARAVLSDFELTKENGPAVAALCRQLDGLPLAIELAAARIDLLGPDAMLERLMQHLPLPSFGAEDAPARHRTLESAIGWSYAQLQPAEQALFRRLAVLPGAWTLDAAEMVADTASLDLDGLTALVALVDKGLLQVVSHGSGPACFAMLETIRSFAMQQLDLSGERDETNRRLADWRRLGHSVCPETIPARPRLGLRAPSVAALATAATQQLESPLSEREQAVLRLVAEGLPSKQIGRQLGLAERTVKAHVTGAMNKLGAFSRAQALAIAVTHNYL